MAERTSALYILKGIYDDNGNISQGIRLDPAHTNICDMDHEAFGQWCTQHAAWHYDTFSYLKHENKIRVDANMFDLATATYLFIDNFQYFPKTFYAFVTGFEYINDGCCFIKFKIDYVRTFWHLIRFGKCFVEREHHISDKIGENTVTEPLALANDWKIAGQAYEDFSDFDYAAFYTKETVNSDDFKTVNGQLIGVPFTTSPSGPMIDLIQSYVNSGQEDRIKQIYAYPTNNSNGMNYTMSRDLDGYTPRFNKCYTAQFNKAVLTDMQGSSQELYFEHAENNIIAIYFNKNIVPQASIQAIPANYDNIRLDYRHSITLNNFPTVIYAGSSYSQYYLQNNVANSINFLNAAMQVAAGNAGGLVSIYELYNKDYLAQQGGSNTYGEKSTTNNLVDLKACGIYILQLCQPAEYIRRIDNYFLRYGYQTNEYKYPNTNSRSDFNYVKTRDCCVFGDCPAEAITEIQSAFNKGVTIWHDINTMCPAQNFG